MEYLINLPIKIDCDKWLRIAEERELWPNNEKTLYFNSTYVPDELKNELLSYFKIPFDIATFHKHYPGEGYRWHKDLNRQTVAICQISEDNPNIYLEIDDNISIKKYHYTRGNFILFDGQILHRVVNEETKKNRYIITMGWHKKNDLEYHSFYTLKQLFDRGTFIDL